MHMETIDVQRLLERVGGLLRSEMRQSLAPYGLQQVHFDALHYLSRCNRFSDTPMAVTEYLGQTKGTVSQTLKVLVRKGLIRKTPDRNDGRVMRLAITSAGRKLLQKLIPGDLLKDSERLLEKGEFDAISHSLRQLLTAMQHANQHRSFAQCDSCMYNQKLSPSRYFCKLTEESLSKTETQLICREHAFAGW